MGKRDEQYGLGGVLELEEGFFIAEISNDTKNNYELEINKKVC